MKITECVRKAGITYLTVSGPDPVKATDKDRLIEIVGVSDHTVNGKHRILAVVPPETIRIAQPGLLDIPAGISGGTVFFEGEHKEGTPAPANAAAAIHDHVPAKTKWVKPAKPAK